MKINKNKKALSPVIATVMLIAIVVVIILIIFLWARGFTKEKVQKFVGENMKDADEVCGEVKFDAQINEISELEIINRGNVPIYQVAIQITREGDIERNYEEINLNEGGATAIDIDASGAEKILVIPQILGEIKSQNQVYTCSESLGVDVGI